MRVRPAAASRCIWPESGACAGPEPRCPVTARYIRFYAIISVMPVGRGFAYPPPASNADTGTAPTARRRLSPAGLGICGLTTPIRWCKIPPYLDLAPNRIRRGFSVGRNASKTERTHTQRGLRNGGPVSWVLRYQEGLGASVANHIGRAALGVADGRGSGPGAPGGIAGFGGCPGHGARRDRGLNG